MRRLLAVALLPLVLTTFAGCTVPGPTPPPIDDALPRSVGVVKVEGVPQRLALVEARDGAGNTLWFSSTGPDGRLNESWGGTVRQLLVHAANGTYELRPGGGFAKAATNRTFSLLDRVQFPNHPVPAGVGTTCTEKDDGDPGCGLDEPSVVVDGRGWVHYTAACCIGGSSPVFTSKDGGKSFTPLANPFKDGYGGEGDLALDAAGNLYYMDIDLVTFGIARWDVDLEPVHGHRRTGEPLVDRPWIRATADGIVHAIYNTGSDTIHYRSTDHGLTFDALPRARFGSALARAYSDPRVGVVGMVGSGAYMESRDHGATWGQREVVDECAGADTATFDEGGTLWFEGNGCVIGRRPDGTWTKPTHYAPQGSDLFMTWSTAGGNGSVAVAYYARFRDLETTRALGLVPQAWYVFVSFTSDADSPDPHWATLLVDPQFVGKGNIGRRLGDFLQVAIGPDGSVHVAYASNPEMDDSARGSYRATTAIPLLAPQKPLQGPFPK